MERQSPNNVKRVRNFSLHRLSGYDIHVEDSMCEALPLLTNLTMLSLGTTHQTFGSIGWPISFGKGIRSLSLTVEDTVIRQTSGLLNLCFNELEEFRLRLRGNGWMFTAPPLGCVPHFISKAQHSLKLISIETDDDYWCQLTNSMTHLRFPQLQTLELLGGWGMSSFDPWKSFLLAHKPHLRHLSLTTWPCGYLIVESLAQVIGGLHSAALLGMWNQWQLPALVKAYTEWEGPKRLKELTIWFHPLCPKIIDDLARGFHDILALNLIFVDMAHHDGLEYPVS